MKCSYCGTEFEGTFCPYCGAPAAASQPVPAAPPVQTTPSPEQEPAQPPDPPQGQKSAGRARFVAVIGIVAVILLVFSIVVSLFSVLAGRFAGGSGGETGTASSEAGRRPVVTESTPESETNRRPIITESEPEDSQPEGSTPAADPITREKYDRLEMGMSYEQVREIFGCEPSSASELGEKGTSGHILMCTWQDAGGVSVSLTFMQDALWYKSQVGLE